VVNTADHGGENPDAFLAGAIVDDAVRRRRAERWGRRAALDDVTVVGTLAACVGEEVVTRLATGQEVRGTVTFVGTEVVQIDAVRSVHWIRADAILAVTPSSGRIAALPDTPWAGDQHDRPLASLLADLVDDGRPVEVHLAGVAAITGMVDAVGASLVLTDSMGHRSVVGLDTVLSVTLAL